jgi:hypothetical protein
MIPCRESPKKVALTLKGLRRGGIGSAPGFQYALARLCVLPDGNDLQRFHREWEMFGQVMLVNVPGYTGWSRSPCGALLFRHLAKNNESHWGSTMLSFLSV